MEVYTALGLSRGFSAEELSVLTMQLCQYKKQWQQQHYLFYYQMKLYDSAARIDCMEVLRCYHDGLIAGHFGAKSTRSTK